MKKLIAMLLALAMILGLVACGNSSSSTETTAAAVVETEAAAPAETEAAASSSAAVELPREEDRKSVV